MIRHKGGVFVLETKSNSYIFRVMDTGHLEHLYYGRKIKMDDELTGVNALTEQHAFPPGNSINYDQEHLQFSLEDACLEMSSYGKGDIRDPFLVIRNADGSRTSDFLYANCSISDGKISVEGCPYSHGNNDEVSELIVCLKDAENNLTLNLSYCVYPEADVITRRCILKNNGKSEVIIERLLSTQLDLPASDYDMITFHGAWTREMNLVRQPLLAGKYEGGSMTGTSSNRNNPFFMISSHETTEDAGDCYGFNLVYSGNHYHCAEVNAYGKVRVNTGIQPEGFEYHLPAGEKFAAPEAVMTYADRGFNELSQHMHAFVRKHILPEKWADKTRPVLLNSWEANYFKINESKLKAQAKLAKEAGVELFVMDDGWFGERNDDTSSLGDWEVNLKKLPGGLAGIAKSINDMGLDFGIWVEPEMVNVNSRLYEAHPDWSMDIPGKAHSEGRNQRVLDLCNPEVVDYLIESMSRAFESANISYVKWDMNRIITDYYSKYLDKEHQGEVAHRYVLGLYRLMSTLTERFPDILFEGCASGGNRFDLGILCYFPQIWGSDNTDAISRMNIQTGYSYGYPLETVGAHVSGCPNHQTLRRTPLETRFAVASFGSLGYECNLADMSKEDLTAVKSQIELYKQWREVMQKGSFYRGRITDNLTEWTVVSEDKKKAVGMIVQGLVAPNTQYQYFQAKGLNPEALYHFYNRNLKYNIKDFGDLVNTVSPVHVKQDSVVHNVLAKVYKMDGETEDYELYGDALMYSGVKLKQAFSGTGYSDQVRYFQDFSSRMYFMIVEE